MTRHQPRCSCRPPAGRPLPARPAQACPLTTPRIDPVLDEIIVRVSGDVVSIGIVSIDAAWCSGELLEHQLQIYVGLASRASLRHTVAVFLHDAADPHQVPPVHLR